jgi:hypothetical protein
MMDNRSFFGFKPICFDSYESESVGSLRTWTGALTSSAEQKEWRSQAYLFVGRPRTGGRCSENMYSIRDSVPIEWSGLAIPR